MSDDAVEINKDDSSLTGEIRSDVVEVVVFARRNKGRSDVLEDDVFARRNEGCWRTDGEKPSIMTTKRAMKSNDCVIL